MKIDIRKKFSDRILNLENKLPLEKFIPSAFFVFLLCVFILSLITYQNIDRYKKDIDWINHSNDILKKIDDINYCLAEIPLLRRGYTITGELKYTEKLDSLIQNLNSGIQNLRGLISGNSTQLEMVDMIDSLAGENISIIINSNSDSSISVNSQVISKKQIATTNNVQDNLLKINTLIKEFKANELELLLKRSDRADNSNSIIQKFIIATGLFSFIVIGLSLFISGKLIRNKKTAGRKTIQF